jgi:3',5'-cyclic AMP phosphodiesterase CpdA
MVTRRELFLGAGAAAVAIGGAALAKESGMGSMAEYEAAVAELRRKPTRAPEIRDLIIAGNTAQIGDPAFVAELKHWLRFSPNAALRTGDGLFSAASGNPALPEWIGPWLFDRVFTVKAETERYSRQIASSAGVAVFVGAGAAR